MYVEYVLDETNKEGIFPPTLSLTIPGGLKAGIRPPRDILVRKTWEKAYYCLPEFKGKSI